MKHLVLKDANFTIASNYTKDEFFKVAMEIESQLSDRKDKFRLLMPTTVFFETIIVLTNLGVAEKIIQTKLWNYLLSEDVFNLTILETSAFRLARNLRQKQLKIKTSDAIIASFGMETEAQIISFDKQMTKNVKNAGYDKIYYCVEEKERKRFFIDLDEIIGNNKQTIRE